MEKIAAVKGSKHTMERHIKETLKPLVDRISKESFVDGYNPSDAECMGLIVSKFLQWDCGDVIEACVEALEDSNAHTFADTLRKAAWIKSNHQEDKLL